MYTPTGADSGEDAPSVRKPSQYYVDGYLARQGTSGAPPQTPLPPSAASPRSTQRRTAKIFYELEKECPKHYYPKLHVVDPAVMRCIRYMLLVLCVVQTLAAVSIGSMATARGMLHDDVNKQFTVGALMLCAFAGVCGLVGVWGKSRGLLLFFYINELWGLSNVCTFFVMALQSDERTGASCEMLRTGEMSAEVLASAGVTPAVCDERASRRASLVAAMIVLMSELWVSCFLAKTYSEYIQDEANDEDDRRQAYQKQAAIDHQSKLRLQIERNKVRRAEEKQQEFLEKKYIEKVEAEHAYIVANEGGRCNIHHPIKSMKWFT